ncbi:class II aldolase/adducin family protein [Rubrivivax benzoatilyticus]|uniref:Aldolase n=1 Tax=Rubrivivax benzoatilyticus TaxID=316997 RepID=A0ABX0HR70_9BURK|nr:aldolase [Rubrivivax benzoatilyticus]EGJ11474.1 putative aldolase [Rubrivivax benzoatilyticus JA2 = ATCC BAA-35]NHK97562.1 aldolase [Rubrivivax benzoatilyticus]NHL22743.1 aldolase [Rubrivivax benzoatilyticus]
MATPFLDEDLARAEICRVGRSLFERGYAHATAGNISVRLADGYLITPTDACLGTLEPARLARLDAEGRQTGGDRGSKTIVLHRRIYVASEATAQPARCIIHTHGTHLVARSLQAEGEAELLPPITPYFVMKVGHVPHIDYQRPGAPEAADAVAEAITRYAAAGRPIRAVMLARLGPNVWHDSPAAAMAVLEELEETARLALLVPEALARPLDEARIQTLRDSFGASW